MVEEKSRTEYSAYNTTIAMLSRILAIVMGYVIRVVFTHTLNENYVGINGLFTDILNVLSLSEMGIETAITFALYQPIACQDTEKQKSIMRLYRTFYHGVALFVLCAGLLVIPFMDVLIKNKPDIAYFTYIYLLYLMSTVLSYLLIYKKTLMDAHQLMYIGTVYKTAAWIIQDVLQIIVLLVTKNFILYLSVHIATVLLANFSISKKAELLYPFLKEKDVKPLPQEERKEIFKNVRAMMMHKLGNVVVNNTDNLLLSSFVGIVSVGRYSNYYLVIGSVQQVLSECFQGITASVGNLNVTSPARRVREVFESAFFVAFWLYTAAGIALFELINPFVELSFGKKYLYPRDIVLVLCINFFLTGMSKSVLVFRDSLGLFFIDRYKAVAEAVLNLGISIVLTRQLGTVGVFLGTMISMLLTTVWVEPYVLYKHHFHCSVCSYFVRYVLYAAEAAFLLGAVHWGCSFVEGGCIRQLLLRGLLCMALPNLVIVLLHWRTKEFRYVRKKALELLFLAINRWKVP